MTTEHSMHLANNSCATGLDTIQLKHCYNVVGEDAIDINYVSEFAHCEEIGSFSHNNWLINILAALPLTLCGIFETPGENTNMWLTLLIFSVIWAIAALVYGQRGGSEIYHAPAAQPLPTGGAGPRRAA